jgi:hypothetical protein
MFIFGSGTAIAQPSGTNQTPLNFGLLQEISIKVSRTSKALYCTYADPLAIGLGTRKWTGKAKTARFSLKVLNELMFGGTLSAGQVTTSYGEPHSVPATSTYVITTTQAATYSNDLGVIYAATGLPLKLVATVSAIGQYSVNEATGVYTFDSLDASAAVLISYNYTISATGQNFSVPPTLIGSQINFSLNVTGMDPTTGGIFTGVFYNCVASDFSLGTKLEDFAMPEFDFQCYANAAGIPALFSTPDTF